LSFKAQMSKWRYCSLNYLKLHFFTAKLKKKLSRDSGHIGTRVLRRAQTP